MNKQAEKHLDRAQGYIERGDDFYGKAADEIIAAKEVTPLTYVELGKRFGKSASVIQRLVESRRAFLRRDEPTETFCVDWERGSHGTKAEIEEGAKKLLETAPLEQVERLIDDLPKKRKVAIGAAAENAYLGLVQEHDEREERLTPEERRKRELDARKSVHKVKGAIAPIQTFGLLLTLSTAKDELHELVASQTLTPELLDKIGQALEELQREFEFAMQMAGE